VTARDVAKTKRPRDPPMTLGKMRQIGVQMLFAYCLNNACRHSALVDVSRYPNEVEVPWFRLRVKCGKCGTRNVDVQPNWKDQPPRKGFAGKQRK
jgi:hypothetical protein